MGRTGRKKAKLDTEYELSASKSRKTSKAKKSKYFDPKPYVMRKIKHFIKSHCPSS